MRKDEHIISKTADEIREILASGGDRTDWARVEAMSQEEVERLADDEDGPLSEGWESTILLGIPEPKKDVHIRLDADVVRWFKARGPGYQTRMNEVLRGFVRARQAHGG